MLLALVAAMAAIIRPIHVQLAALEEKIASHQVGDHPAVQTEQIKSLRKDTDRIESHRFSTDDAAQWERLKALERAVYGKAVKNGPSN